MSRKGRPPDGLSSFLEVTMPSTALATAADVAYWTGRPVGTIWRWASEGRIAVYGHGKKARYDVMDIDPAVRDDDGTVITPTPAPPVIGRQRVAAA
ncbi:helix-turn-helix domain-containing protein [Streptomyces diastatochromogenes]|uniref:helix-turn-helix domain-containing protein n=1 Tax=Streptomyces diastatochromogenes TaxID=42236 RepID=UPI002F26596E